MRSSSSLLKNEISNEPLPLGVVQFHFGGEDFTQARFQIRNVRVAGGGGQCFRSRGGGFLALRLPFGDQPFRLADVQRFLDNAFSGELLALFVRETENHFGVADGELAVANEVLHARWQFKETQSIGDDGAALADLGGNFLLRELKLLGQLRVAERFFNGIEIFALEVFDEGQFENGAVIGFARDDGDFGRFRSWAARQRRSPAINSK